MAGKGFGQSNFWHGLPQEPFFCKPWGGLRMLVINKSNKKSVLFILRELNIYLEMNYELESVCIVHGSNYSAQGWDLESGTRIQTTVLFLLVKLSYFSWRGSRLVAHHSLFCCHFMFTQITELKANHYEQEKNMRLKLQNLQKQHTEAIEQLQVLPGPIRKTINPLKTKHLAKYVAKAYIAADKWSQLCDLSTLLSESMKKLLRVGYFSHFFFVLTPLQTICNLFAPLLGPKWDTLFA